MSDIKIVNVITHCDNDGTIKAVEIKLRSKGELSDHPLMATSSKAFFNTTILTDSGDSLQIIPNENRNNVVNFKVGFEDNGLSYEDIGKFLDAFKEALKDETINF